MRDEMNSFQQKLSNEANKKYTSPQIFVYGKLTNLTQGMSGTRADGQGSSGSGNQGAGS